MEVTRKMVYVGNLPYGVTEKTLGAAFIPFGEVSAIVLPPSSAA